MTEQADLTRTQRYVLEYLETRGPREMGRRYTLSLRLLEERGFVRRSMAGKWSLTATGLATLRTNGKAATTEDGLKEAIERLRKDLDRPGGLGPQLVSSGEAIVEKADLRAALRAMEANNA